MKYMIEADIERAAGILLDLRRHGGTLEDLPDDLIPGNTADIQRIIDRVNAEIDRPVRGWKVYCVYKPMQPIFFTPVYDAFESGARIPPEISQLRLIEPEIMFRVDRDLPAREQRYTHEEVAQAVTAVVGFEVIGTRFHMGSLEDITKRSKSQKSNFGSLSDNIANGCIVVGEAIPEWRDIAFEERRVRMTEGDRILVDYVGGHPFDDPFLTVLVGVNRMRRQRGVRRGEIILTSSSTSFFPVSPGTRIRAEYEGVGSVEATFA